MELLHPLRPGFPLGGAPPSGLPVEVEHVVGDQKSSCGMPRISFTRAISSAPSGSPWAFGLSVKLGDG